MTGTQALETATLWGGWWAVFTVLAAGGQTLRNAMQRSLTESLGTLGATHVRFLFGLPFACLALAGVWWVLRFPWPDTPPRWWAWTAAGAVCQIGATALMLGAMRERSFVVATAYVKTEPVQVAVFGLAFLGERLSWLGMLAVAVATTGVMLMSWPRVPAAAAGASVRERLRPALLGISAGGMFALSAVCFRGGILTLQGASFVPKATLTLVASLAIQTALLSAWLAWRSPGLLSRVLASWRQSSLAGAAGAFASQMWFLAFAIEAAARVRALGLVEILFAQLVSRRLFAGDTSPREAAGIGMVAVGVLALLTG